MWSYHYSQYTPFGVDTDNLGFYEGHFVNNAHYFFTYMYILF